MAEQKALLEEKKRKKMFPKKLSNPFLLPLTISSQAAATEKC